MEPSVPCWDVKVPDVFFDRPREFHTLQATMLAILVRADTKLGSTSCDRRAAEPEWETKGLEVPEVQRLDPSSRARSDPPERSLLELFDAFSDSGDLGCKAQSGLNVYVVNRGREVEAHLVPWPSPKFGHQTGRSRFPFPALLAWADADT